MGSICIIWLHLKHTKRNVSNIQRGWNQRKHIKMYIPKVSQFGVSFNGIWICGIRFYKNKEIEECLHQDLISFRWLGDDGITANKMIKRNPHIRNWFDSWCRKVWLFFNSRIKINKLILNLIHDDTNEFSWFMDHVSMDPNIGSSIIQLKSGFMDDGQSGRISKNTPQLEFFKFRANELSSIKDIHQLKRLKSLS